MNEPGPQEHAEVCTGLRYYTLSAWLPPPGSCPPVSYSPSPLSTSDVEAAEEGFTSLVQDQLLPFRFEAAEH